MIHSVFSHFGSRTTAIVLSGMLPAGVEGLRAVRAGGEITMAQNRRSATDFEMPSAAIDLGRAEIVCSPSRMAQVLTLLAQDWREGAVETWPARAETDHQRGGGRDAATGSPDLRPSLAGWAT